MAKVVPLASAKAFLDALEKSGLLGAGDVTSLRAAHGEDSDPRLVARDLVKENKLTKWQAGQLIHGFHQLTVGKYKMMDQLGSGEMGRVYLGEHAQLGRKVSLKILSRKYTANPEILKKVLEDGRRASALDHRNLTHVFDVNSEEERYYLVTEFVEGKDLKQLVEASGATSTAQAMELVRQAAEGLEHAHGQGVIHGDLKPSNVIVDPSGTVKILDLGLARLTETKTVADGEESTEVATLAAQSFHAPEQSQQMSPLVDIYALGGILYYLLTGKPPLKVKQAQDVKDACGAANDELADLCFRMLSADPAARPQSAREVIEGLDAAGRAKPKPIPKSEEKKSSNGEKPKQKKPLVAKPLEIPFPTAAATPAATTPAATAPAAKVEEATPAKAEEISLDGLTVEEPTQPAATSEIAAASEDTVASMPAALDPFAGFNVSTKRKKQKSAAEPAAPPVATTAPAEDSAPAPAKTGKKPSMTLVIAAGVGGGVLILALGVTALVFALSRGGKPDKTAVAKATDNKGGAAAASPTGTSPEGNPEANPEANPEENPKPENPPAAATTPEKTNPKPTEGPKATVPMPMPTTPMPMTPANTTPPTPMPMTPVVTTPQPMPKPEPPKPEPPVPMPMPEAPVGNPLVGFVPNVTLPPLEEKGKPVAEPTKPLVLGTIKIPPKVLCFISLKGGDNAISTNAKQKFVVEEGNNGTSLRDWDIKIQTEGAAAKVVVAKLALQNDQLTFQWTEDAVKQITSAPYLCNCALTMKAGEGSHLLALRAPLKGDPLKVDLEKAMTAKYTIEYPPNPKQIIVQLAVPEGKFGKFKHDKAELTAKTDNTMFSAGPGDEAQLLHIKLVTTMNGKLLKVDGQPGYMIHGMTKPDKYIKGKMARLIPDTETASQQAILNQQSVGADKTITAERRPQADAEAKKLVDDTAARKTQAVMLRDLVKDLQGDGKIHFNIFYEADTETKIPLLSTGGAPPPMAPVTP